MHQIEQLTIPELTLREQAYQLRTLDNQELLLTSQFNRRAVDAADKAGKYLFTKPNEIIDFEDIRAQITGARKSNVSYYKALSDRAKWAREEALKNLEERGKIDG